MVAGWSDSLPSLSLLSLPSHSLLTRAPTARSALQVLRKIASFEEEQLGDTSTLADPTVVETLIHYRGK